MILLILATAIPLILGFFNPRASLFWYHKEPTTTLSSFIYGGFLVFFIYLIAPTSQERVVETAVDSATVTMDTMETKMDTSATVPAKIVEYPVTIEGERILRELKARAERDWPYDYSTQRYWYNEQIEARERLNR
ncbi:MAG: hypothetical protein JWR38_5294 [Mucilaginibacter sp.]|nr:hypothetical protein [Mucilaginibacter sp.]